MSTEFIPWFFCPRALSQISLFCIRGDKWQLLCTVDTCDLRFHPLLVGTGAFYLWVVMPTWNSMNQPADVFDHEWPPEDVDEYENHYFEEEWPLGETDLHDDLDDPIQAPQSFNVNEPNPGRPDVPVVATPRLSWCCLRCDASNYDWNPEAENWQCTECSGTEFYKTDRPTKIVREHGSWLYLPFGHDAPASSSQKRRRRRMRGKYDPSGDDSLPRETAESEVPTADPVVEVEPRQTHAAQLPLGSHRHDLPATRRSIHASPSAKTSDERLVAALTKALDKKSDSEEWSSLKGPFKGVRWRGGTPPHPPTWSYDKDDLRAYNKYVKKVEIWMLQVAPYMTKKEAALQLYGALQGEAEQELEHTPVSEIYCDDGVQKILSALQAPMEQKQIYQKRRYLHEFENLRRNHGETLRAYVNRFRRVQRSLRSVGIEVSYTYDSESLGARLLDRSGLSHEQQRMLLVGTSQSLAFDQLAEAMVLQFPDYRGAPPILGANGREVSKGSSKGKPSSSPSSTASSSSSTTNSHTSYRTSSTALSSSSGKGGSVKRAFVAEVEQPANDDTPENLETIDEEPQAEEEADQSADSEHTAQEGDDPDLSELAEVLTITAKKLSGLTLGRKWAKSKPSGPRDRASPSDAKKHTHCSACGAKGHWYQDPECPKNQGTSSRSPPSNRVPDKKRHAVGVIHHEHGAVSIHDQQEQEYGQIFSVGMIHNMDIHHAFTAAHVDVFAGFLVLDSGCQRTCCGKQWMNAHLTKLKQFDLLPYSVKAEDVFQFGKGSPSKSSTRTFLPSGVGGEPFLLGTCVLEENIPCLGSNSLLTQLGAVLDLSADLVTFRKLGVTTKIHRLGGHMAIDIMDFSQDSFDQKFWKEMFDHVTPEDSEILLPSISCPSNAPASTSMVGVMASDSAHHQERVQGLHPPSCVSHQSEPNAPRRTSSTTTTSEHQSQSRHMRSLPVQEVRQSTRQICTVPSMPDQVEVERSPRKVAASWTKRTLFAIATFATTIFGNDRNFSAIFNSGDTCSHVQSESQSHTGTHFQHVSSPSDSMDILRQHGAPHGPLDGGGASGSHADHDPRESHTRTPNGHSQLDVGGLGQRPRPRGGSSEGGAAGRSEAMGQTHRVGSDPESGQRDLRLRVERGGSMTLKPGTAKRLRGQWKQSANILLSEVNITQRITPTSSRPSPSVDLWELFAGEALSTKLAPEYDLDVLQPYDLIYGQDFMKEEVQNSIFKTLRRFRPLLTLMGLDCRHYNLFQLQQGDAPLRQMAASVAEEQLKNNRYFLMRSEVWETPEMERLKQLPGVWTVTCDSGVFGLMVHGHHVAKPITFIGNIPGLDEQLSRRLLPEQRQQCTPIQGKLTRASQAYPEELCRTILEALRRVARELQPQRFCTRQRGVHQALPVQQPTTDLAAWDSVYQHLDAAFSQSSKRPFLIATNSEMGKYIQSLFRIDAIKIQAVASPTTRRIPSNVDEWSTRACCLFFADDDRKVEVEDLDNVRFPKQKFHKTVRYAVFAYGARRELPATSEQQQPEQTEPGPAIVPGLPTDIDFPGTSQQSLSQEVKRTVARLHLNLGHPTSQELCRLLAYEGNVPDMVYQAVRHLRCATCERLKPPQKPRPSTMPSLTVGQFNDELQADICYCRTVTATTFMILGVVDRATGLHQAGILDDRNSETCFQLLHDLWLRPFGLPLRLLCDPDPSFKGMFQHRVQAIGIHLDYCPPEAHHIIGMIERRNSVLRLILEKLIDQFAVDIPERCQVLVSAACHAINSQIQTHGRSAYQAVFGRQPRLLDSNFNDPMILATSSSAIRDETNPGLRADLVRNEAIKTLHNLDVSQHLRRALLRKTRKTNIADLQPGQKCAFWRWSRRGGPRKRGTWVIGRFLSWDPSHPGKQAWIRSGATTILATAEQIRAAFGFEDWAPDLQDIAALKNASTSFTDQLLDDRGPEPPDLNIEDDDIFDPESAAIPPTPSMMVPATPVPQTEPPAKPASSSMQPRQSDTVIQQQSTIQVNIDSPTHITNKTMQFQRFGDIPTRSRKHRSRTPNSRRTEVRDKPVSQPPAELPPAEAPTILPPAATMTDEQPSTLTLPQPTEEQQSLEHMPPQTVSQFLGQGDTILDPTEPEQHQPGPTQGSTAQSSASQTMQHDVVPETPQVIEVEDDSTDNMLPQKRTFDSLITLRPLGHNKIQRVSSQWDGSPLIGFGPKSNRYHKAYLTTHQRKQDVLQENKPPEEPDTTDDSSSDETEQVNKPQTMQLALKTSSKQKQSGKTALQPMQPAYKQGMTRQEVKALDREIPWRTILSMPPSYVDKFLAAIDKEAVAWQQWQSVEPLSDKQAQEVFSDPVLSKRILPSRACYRDKACGIGDVVAKCRIVALGHLDPDLQQLSRNASTPGRIAEHIMFLMIVSGSNRCLFDTQQLWITWIGDAKTAFLQGVQDPQERDGPLFMRPPRDGLISRTNHWTAALYRIRGNVYGLANAPITWQREVCRRLAHLKFTQHMFDKQLVRQIHRLWWSASSSPSLCWRLRRSLSTRLSHSTSVWSFSMGISTRTGSGQTSDF